MVRQSLIKPLSALGVLCCSLAVLVPGAVWAHGRRFGGTARFQEAVTLDGVRQHLLALQAVATNNANTRASGTPGYDASVAYVERELLEAGYQPVRQALEVGLFHEITPTLLEQLSPVVATYPPDDPAGVWSLTYSPSGDVTGRVQGVDLTLPPSDVPNSSSSGCEPDDFVGFAPGNIALMQRGVCSFLQKAANAEAAGAIAAVFFNEGQPGRIEAYPGMLPEPAVGLPTITIPTISISHALGAELAAAPNAEVHLVVNRMNEFRPTENLFADSRCGDASQTIVVGAHLDSVMQGPGINDNASGSAIVLEVAKRLADLPCRGRGVRLRNRVRFAFWGAEEVGLVGSRHYLEALAPDELMQIALYLNFDMLGSPNFVRFVYDGDGSGGGVAGPPGSEQIEQLFVEHFAALGQATAPSSLDGGSDYASFVEWGIPVGGLLTGANGVKTDAEAALFGGSAGLPYDSCYHQACDDISNVSHLVLDQLADAVAHAVLTMASRRQPLDPPAPVGIDAGADAGVQ